MRSLTRFLAFAGISCLTIQPLLAVPHLINLEGRLTDQKGNPITSPTQVEFRLYQGGGSSAADAGTVVYKEISTITPASDGTYSYILGTGSALDGLQLTPTAFNTAQDVYLQLNIDNQAVLPRLRIVSQAWALMAETIQDGAVTTSKIADGNVTKAKLASDVSGSIPPGPHAATHRAGGSDPVQLTSSQVDGTALVANSTSSQTLNGDLGVTGNLTVGGTITGAQSNAVKLSGSTAYLSSWQSSQDSTKIDSTKILGTVTPAAHAATHRLGGGDAVQFTASQVDGMALVVQPSADQVLQPSQDVIPLIIKGKPNSQASRVLSIYDASASPLEQAYFDASGNLTLKKNESITGNLIVSGSISGVQSNAVILSGSNAFLSSWQSASDLTKIDSTKILGTVPPGPHAANHRAGGGDAVQLVPSQIDGTALVAQPTSDQTLQGNLTVSQNLTANNQLTVSGEDVQSHLIPTGMIAMFDQSCPSGWSRFSALDGRFPEGASSYGGTGGSATHSHTVNPHTHSISTDGAHSHTVNAHSHSIPDSGTLTTNPTNDTADDVSAQASDRSVARIGHTHTIPSHNHGGSTGSASPGTDTQGSHNHGGQTGNSSPGTDTQSNIPPYLNVVWCKKNG